MGDEPRIAFVQDALPFQGGAEKVLEAALEAFPAAAIYTLIYREEAFRGTPIGNRPVHASVLNHLPGAKSHHRAFLPLMPLAVERLNLRAYDLVVSFSYAVAHGIRIRPDQLHINYIHTPLRYAWQASPALNQAYSPLPAPLRWVLRAYLRSFSRWDRAAAARVNRFLTVSDWMASCVWHAYHRRAQVLYPPVDVHRFQPGYPREDTYITVSRLVPHKRVDLVVEAFNQLGLPLMIIGDGPDLDRLRRMAGPTVHMPGWQPEPALAEALGKARAFIHAGEEDFGIALVEAQAAGCPVIALRRGSAPEIIQEGKTGLLFSEQTPEALAGAVRRFEANGVALDPQAIRQNAVRFDRPRFIESFSASVLESWSQFQQNWRAEVDHARFYRGLTTRDGSEAES